jgi:hypothetical protein
VVWQFNKRAVTELTYLPAKDTLKDLRGAAKRRILFD